MKTSTAVIILIGMLLVWYVGSSLIATSDLPFWVKFMLLS